MEKTENSLFNEIKGLATEQRNKSSLDIDLVSTEEMLRIINDEDKKVALAVEKVIPEISFAVEKIVESFKNNGRLFYFGAGTSGRLGILDAAECPPTFGSDSSLVQAYIAGGTEAVFQAVEGAEDSFQNGKEQIEFLQINQNDVVCGIAASGRTPYVLGILNEAKQNGIYTILITTVGVEKTKELGVNCDLVISPNVGPEVITGSTRMKSGTAQKLILNMLTTGSMVKIGKTYSNIMVDLQLKNAKLRERAKNMIMNICDVSYEEAESFLEKSGGKVKPAIVMALKNVDFNEANLLLNKSNGFIREIK